MHFIYMPLNAFSSGKNLLKYQISLQKRIRFVVNLMDAVAYDLYGHITLARLGKKTLRLTIP